MKWFSSLSLTSSLAFALGACAAGSSSNGGGGVFLQPVADSVAAEVLTLHFGRSTAVAFPAAYEPPFSLSPELDRFTPDSALVRLLERKVAEQYVEANMRFVRHQVNDRGLEVYSEPLDAQAKPRELQSAKKWSERWARKLPRLDKQYVALVNDEGERVVVIQLLDFSRDPHGLRDSTSKAWISGWHGWFETNVRVLEYIVEKDRLNAWGWAQL